MADEPLRPRSAETGLLPPEALPAVEDVELETAEVAEQPEVAEAAPQPEEERPEPAVAETSAPVAPTTTPVAAAPAKDQITKQIESVLAEDMTDLFLSMPPSKQQEFKRKGEETASKIRVLVNKASQNARKIFALIRAWLKLVPGVNRFFLEQEAKIKTDKIVMAAEERASHGE